MPDQTLDDLAPQGDPLAGWCRWCDSGRVLAGWAFVCPGCDSEEGS